jgi:hypothetical protein
MNRVADRGVGPMRFADAIAELGCPIQISAGTGAVLTPYFASSNTLDSIQPQVLQQSRSR